ncbi:alpha/beta hydrolase [Mycobacterium sp. 2YAF39]
MRRLVVIGTVVVMVLAGAVAVVWWQQWRLVYYPATGAMPSAATVLPNGQDVTLETDDGIRLGAWYFPVPGGGPAFLVSHGNGGDRAGLADLAEALNSRGHSVLMFDYRGFAGNPGRPSEDGTAADERAAQAWLAKQPGVDKIVYFGESLGAAVALGLAVEKPPAALILRSPFTSLHEVASVHYPVVGGLLADRYPSIDRIGKVHVPVMVIAGDRDDTVPEEMSRRLYDAANEPKRFVMVPGAGHNDREFVNGNRMLDEIQGFLSSTGVT